MRRPLFRWDYVPGFGWVKWQRVWGGLPYRTRWFAGSPQEIIRQVLCWREEET